MDFLIDFVRSTISFILHIDEHLSTIIANYGNATYLILILIVFCETGLVITPFLPGDSLLFAAGAFAGRGLLNPMVLFVALSIAAVVGDTVNYWIGRVIGPRVFQRETRFIKRKHLEKTQRFYEKHGGKAIVLARFMPIIRTFAPFVAGIGVMDYKKFVFYNVVGGVVWVGLFVFAGYFFGNIPTVENNFELVILVIIFLSILPPVIEYLRSRKAAT
ncbi:MAG: DedA family protein [Gemmatimonadota bacterium]